MKIPTLVLFLTVCFFITVAQAQLSVIIAPPKITGQKALVLLTMTNKFDASIDAARAACFLRDEQGQIVGHSTKWVIGENKTKLESKHGTTFNFVLPVRQPLVATNLSAKVIFSRVVLAGGKLANPEKDVTVTTTQASH